MSKPQLLLRIEGVAVFIAACVLFSQSPGHWLWFALLFLVPDLSWLGYFANKRVGATIYNSVHTYATPLLILGVLWLSGHTSEAWLTLIWFAHIGLDRAFGYGLKYNTAFQDTHLQRV